MQNVQCRMQQDIYEYKGCEIASYKWYNNYNDSFIKVQRSSNDNQKGIYIKTQRIIVLLRTLYYIETTILINIWELTWKEKKTLKKHLKKKFYWKKEKKISK